MDDDEEESTDASPAQRLPRGPEIRALFKRLTGRDATDGDNDFWLLNDILGIFASSDDDKLEYLRGAIREATGASSLEAQHVQAVEAVRASMAARRRQRAEVEELRRSARPIPGHADPDAAAEAELGCIPVGGLPLAFLEGGAPVLREALDEALDEGWPATKLTADLCLRCEALGFVQHDGEDFDKARARVTRRLASAVSRHKSAKKSTH